MVDYVQANTGVAHGADEDRLSLDDLLSAIDASYEQAMWVVHTGAADGPLATTIRDQCKRVAELREDAPGASESDKEIERRWWTLQRLFAVNLDSLAVLVKPPIPARATRQGDRSPGSEPADPTPLVSAVTARVLERVDPQLERIDRSAAISRLFDSFRLYHERLLALANEACLERARLCLAVAPGQNRPYWGLTASGYSGDVYGAGWFMSISHITGVHPKLVHGRRAVVGFQVLKQPRGWATEVSGGSVFGDFVVMPGLIVSPRHGHALQLSGSVLYLPRSRLSLGVGYAVDYGLGIRAVYGFRPKPPKHKTTSGRSR